jgi:hypothetical protein
MMAWILYCFGAFLAVMQDTPSDSFPSIPFTALILGLFVMIAIWEKLKRLMDVALGGIAIMLVYFVTLPNRADFSMSIVFFFLSIPYLVALGKRIRNKDKEQKKN